MIKQNNSKISSNSYTDIIPYAQYERSEAAWHDGMVTGNGEDGVICSCAPYSDLLIYQNTDFNMPSNAPRVIPPEVRGELEEARQAVIHFDDTWNVNDRKRTYLYSFHPGHSLRLSLPKQELADYERQTDLETAEVSVNYKDQNGTWMRSTFTSREDRVTITQMRESDTGHKVNVILSIDDLSSYKYFGKGNEVNLQYKKLVDDECDYISMVAHYPSFKESELKEGGFAGVTKVIVIGGTKEKIIQPDTQEAINVGVEKNPAIMIRDAEAVYLITKSARTHRMGALSDFTAAGNYQLLDELMTYIDKVAKKYVDDKNNFSYDLALQPHAMKQSKLFHAVSFRLGSEQGKDLFNEELIKEQKSNSLLMDSMVERAYHVGRYIQICCSGSSAPRLGGLWTGEWNGGWRGSYTMDANVNIQVSGMNTGNVYDAAIGYIYFILRQMKDWEENAKYVYGMQDALLSPVNTDGDRSIMVQYDQHFPFQYWNSGASWMILPIFEFWQCFGNCKIPVNDRISHLYSREYLDLENDVLLPLLRKQANFWEQLCTPEYYTNLDGQACYEKGKKKLNDGEKYIILPTYSPENKPLGYNSGITANATMDISAARDVLKMIIELEKSMAKKGFESEVARWERLIKQLPDYKYDDSGALCEWAMKEYQENNAHRHISHLYCAWPAYETQGDEALTEACNRAIINRNKENQGIDDTASHGWLHKALVAARLKNGESAYDSLYTIMSSDIYYTSFMTDHNTDRSFGVFCTDTSIGTVGIINEMLLYSNTGEIELLPALPKKWTRGSVNGLLARTNAQVTRLCWDLENKTIEATIHSFVEQSIKISYPARDVIFEASNGQKLSNGEAVMFHKDEEVSLKINYCD